MDSNILTFGGKIEKRALHGKTKHIVFDCMLAETLKLLVMYSFTWCASLKKREKKKQKSYDCKP